MQEGMPPGARSAAATGGRRKPTGAPPDSAADIAGATLGLHRMCPQPQQRVPRTPREQGWRQHSHTGAHSERSCLGTPVLTMTRGAPGITGLGANEAAESQCP